MKPGLYDLKNAEYHSGEGLSSSGIKELIKSAAHFKQWVSEPMEPTPEMVKGTLVHAMLLEPEIVEKEFAVGKFNIRRGKEYEAAIAANPGKTIISVDEYAEAQKIKEAFLIEKDLNPELAALCEGIKEKSFFWEDKTTGVLCKVRPDNLTAHGIVVDLKTTRDASFDAFQKQMVDLKYFVSAAFYIDGVCETLSQASIDMHKPDRFSFVCVETKAPYAVKIYNLDSQAIQIGRDLIRLALERFALAVSTDEWPGYDRAPIDMGLPSWALYRLNHVSGNK